MTQIRADEAWLQFQESKICQYLRHLWPMFGLDFDCGLGRAGESVVRFAGKKRTRLDSVAGRLTRWDTGREAGL
jgi:hypothetical protein